MYSIGMYHREPTVGEGLTVVRFAPPEYEEVIWGLNEEFGHLPVVDIRRFDTGDNRSNRREPGIRLLQAHEIYSRRWPQGRLLRPIIESLDQEIPALHEPLPVNFLEADISETHRGDSFVVLTPDNDGMQALTNQRTAILRGIEKAAHVPQQNWRGNPLDMTVAWINPNAEPRIVDEIAEYVSGLLPLRLELEPAEFFPDLRAESQH